MPVSVIVPQDIRCAVLRVPQSVLDLEHTVASGQCFRWERGTDGWWTAVIGPEPTVLHCIQEPEQIRYTVFSDDSERCLRDYFQLDVRLDALADDWRGAAGPEISDALTVFEGLRVTRQDPVECLFSFLCSSVAPIYRIRRSIANMCRELGEKVNAFGAETLYTFPTIERLAETNRTAYDAMGLGFRGGNVQRTAQELIARGGRPYVLSLREASYADAKAALMSLPGVGAKIADCVCLFSLDKPQAVPMDVHVTRIGKRLFPEMQDIKGLTPKTYDALGDAYRDRFGHYAGWAQQYLFYNEILRNGSWDKEMGTHVPGKRVG